ncbi:MAG: hypothetical protein ACI3XJ_12700 [Oscillospiraceae bacterium]
MANVTFKVGTLAQYDALETKNADTLYWLTDVQRVYKGDALFGTGTTATVAMAGLLSPEDKAKLDSIVASGGEATVIDLSALDTSITIADTESGKAIGVALSAVEGNVLELKTDGLFAAVPTATLDESLANGLVVGTAGLGLNLATTTASGAMSAEDKTTLDTLGTTVSALAEACTWSEM